MARLSFLSFGQYSLIFPFACEDTAPAPREARCVVGLTYSSLSTNFNPSSIKMTGRLTRMMACHSVQFSGSMLNKAWRNGIYRIAKWRTMDKVIAYISFMFSQSGIVSSDSEDERAFIALNISMTTRMESDMVEPFRAATADGANIEQLVVANSDDRALHLWKWD
jgi:hypothetical protein